MKNPKIEKLDNEIKRTKSKIAELRSKLRIMERQKRELEDAEVLSLVRNERISDAELTELILSIRKGEKAPDAANNKLTRKGKTEETHNANEEE